MAIVKENSPRKELEAVLAIRERLLAQINKHLDECEDVTDVYLEDVGTVLRWLEGPLDISEISVNINNSSASLNEGAELIKVGERLDF